jgi:hypothetical protein
MTAQEILSRVNEISFEKFQDINFNLFSTLEISLIN